MCRFLLFLLFFPCLNVTLSLCPRDDNFSDTLSQKADSEASSGHAGEDKCSGKDIGSPNETRISEAYFARLVGLVFITGILHLHSMYNLQNIEHLQF